MCAGIIIYNICLILWVPGKLNAQHVIYSDLLSTHASMNYQVIGKSGNFYWVEKLKKRHINERHTTSIITELQSFVLFDAGLNYIREIPAVSVPDIRKQWLVAGENGLDQIIVTSSLGKTAIFRSHFNINDQIDEKSATVDSLPFSVNPSTLLLVRSEHQSKNLLLAFDNSDIQLTRVNAILFDANWKTIYHETISGDFFSQPCIQDDEIGFASESFDNLPVKLADNGEWTMASHSIKSADFSLFNSSGDGRDYNFKEFPVSRFYQMEDIAMSIDNEKDEVNIGLLSAYSNTSLKSVQVFDYSMKAGKFIFDSAYRFNEQARDIQSKNLTHERFVSVPGTGYLILKEYGPPFEFAKPGIPSLNNWEIEYLLTNYSEGKTGNKQIKNGYTSNRGLSPISSIPNKGDLNIFYFPSAPNDSSWSGVLDMEQYAESNNPELSYLVIPTKNKMYVIYNNVDQSDKTFATTTELNLHGQASDGTLVFWKINKILNFQMSRRITDDEIAVPYTNNLQTGIAVIRL